MDSQDIYAAVNRRYTSLSSGTGQHSVKYGKAVAQAFGYEAKDLGAIPVESNLGLSCGNPLAIASLQEGETVVDLGCGAGLDVFLAANKVGPSGRVIGVDMNKLAESNRARAQANNVEFVESHITDIPLEAGIADIVISNCVINLVPEPDKQLVFNEMFRLLKPGGRVSISDTLAKKSMSKNLRKSMSAYVGCIAGASLVSQYEAYLKEAGFAEFLLEDTKSDLNVYVDTMADGTKRCEPGANIDLSGGSCCLPKDTAEQHDNRECCIPPTTPMGDLEQLATELAGIDINEWVGSFKLFAVKL